MSLNRIVPAGFDYQNQPDFSGPLELANSLIAMSQSMPHPVPLPCSEESLRRIVELAFSTSLLAEEGRFPRFRIIVDTGDPEKLAFPMRMRLITPLAIESVGELRKLAPAVSGPDMALWIAETERDGTNVLVCKGILDSTAYSQAAMIGHAETNEGRSGSGTSGVSWIAIGIESPGQLRAGCFGTMNDLLLRGGQIRPVMSCSSIIGMSMPGVEDYFATRIKARAGELSPHLYPETWRQRLRGVLPELLSIIVEKKHGGTIVVIPGVDSKAADVRETFGFKDGFDVSLDIGAAFVDFCVACATVKKIKSEGAPKSGSENVQTAAIEAANTWLEAQRSLQRTIRVAAMLTSVDGCVVMDRSLTVHLFGAKIVEPIAKAGEQRTILPMCKARSDNVIEDAVMKQFGTRTTSACRFCRWFPNCAAYVVSQDTDLRIFFSNARACFPFEWLEARHWTGLVE